MATTTAQEEILLLSPQDFSLSAVLAKLGHREFCAVLSFDEEFMAQLMYDGFLTMANTCWLKGQRVELLMPKLHQYRCVVEFGQVPRTPRSVVKRAERRRYTITVNRDPAAVCAGIVEQHGQNWFYPRLRAALTSMCGRKLKNDKIRVWSFEVWASSPPPSPSSSSSSSSSSSAAAAEGESQDPERKNGVLVAGEIGVSAGSVYTSYSGFMRESGSGTVQMFSMAKLLEQSGFVLWDLGMGMEYKHKTYKGRDVPRSAFLARLAELRDDLAPGCALDALSTPQGRFCAELLKNNP